MKKDEIKNEMLQLAEYISGSKEITDLAIIGTIDCIFNKRFPVGVTTKKLQKEFFKLDRKEQKELLIEFLQML
ncbi:hypothetical protein [Enterococcus rivorum]|nr:hypothetical protein [Enterococcus rivorum]MBP2098875.1 hypothetical protein [Enterococcus rivorum]